MASHVGAYNIILHELRTGLSQIGLQTKASISWLLNSMLTIKFLLAVLAVAGGLSVFAQPKINGVSLVGHPSPIEYSDLNPIVEINANWVTLIPFGYGKSGNNRLIYKDLSWQWWGETYEGIESSIEMAENLDLEVMIKPQIWFDHGTYTGHFELESDLDWQQFETDYYHYIMSFAYLSEEYGLDLFCIGTELTIFANKRPDFWRRLIRDIRDVYSGQLTYAGNWDSYNTISFWDELDYIGVDAYFPICEHKTPGYNALAKGWKQHSNDLENFSKNEGIPILFTEWGYRSSDYCAKEPWDYSKRQDVNFNGQYNAYQAIFETFWTQSWFAGGFLWKWYPLHSQAGGPKNSRFTPQNKPAQDLLREWFGKT
jgi:hypothetical protein